MMLPIDATHFSSSRYLRATLLSMAFISLATNSTLAKTSATLIHFDRGHVSTTVTGTLNPKQNERWYQFSAAKGQYALINIAPLVGTLETANVGILHMPNGRQEGTKGGIIYQGCLPASGNYRLRIARNLMATNGNTAGYVAEVIILPTYASQSLCQ